MSSVPFGDIHTKSGGDDELRSLMMLVDGTMFDAKSGSEVIAGKYTNGLWCW